MALFLGFVQLELHGELRCGKILHTAGLEDNSGLKQLYNLLQHFIRESVQKGQSWDVTEGCEAVLVLPNLLVETCNRLGCDLLRHPPTWIIVRALWQVHLPLQRTGLCDCWNVAAADSFCILTLVPLLLHLNVDRGPQSIRASTTTVKALLGINKALSS